MKLVAKLGKVKHFTQAVFYGAKHFASAASGARSEIHPVWPSVN